MDWRLMEVYKTSSGERVIGPLKATSWGCDKQRTNWFTNYIKASLGTPTNTENPAIKVTQKESTKTEISENDNQICKNLRSKALKHIEKEQYQQAAEVKNLMVSFGC